MPAAAPTRVRSTTSAALARLEALRSRTASGPALRALTPASYARDHAAFEARSDQRQLISAYLRHRLGRRGPGPLSVLSVGCGDGSVDVPLARWLTGRAPGRPVRYVGVEPFAGSAAAFLARMTGLGRPSLDTEVHATTFEAAAVTGPFDVVMFVHSMYYVPDVAEALLAASRLLRPGGELLVLAAPVGALNHLAGALAPPVEGHRQWFSDDVAAGFEAAGLEAAGLDRCEQITLEARLDLAAAGDGVLDFTVQARLTRTLRPLVLAYLAEVALPGTTMTVPHPVDVHRSIRL